MKNIKRHLLALLAVPALVLSIAAVATPAYAADCDPDGTATSVTGTTAATGMSLCNGALSSKGDGQQTNLFGTGGVFQTVTNVLLFIIGAVSVIMLIIGGIRYTVSQGDSNAVTSAKNTILYSIVGIVIAILAYAAVNFVISSLAANQS